jgi:UMF1 family MFS transporter
MERRAMANSTKSAAASGSGTAVAGTAGLVGWVMFDWAAQPFFTLVETFLFAPYFANEFVGDPVRGQALWGYTAAVAGILVAVCSPIIGALADSAPRIKPWIALCSAFFIAGMSALWFAAPGSPGALWIVLPALVIAMLMSEATIVLTNTMMTSLVPEEKLGRLSGIGWAVGYAGGLVSLVIMIALVIADPATGKTMLGLSPILPLDASQRQGDRLVGPFSALWYLVFVLPLFLFTPDRPPPAHPKPASAALAEFKGTLKELPRYPNILTYLVARMLYIDGLSAVFTFGGIYGVALFNWGDMERGLFGIIIIIAGAIGAVAGGYLDDKLGSKRVILMALVGVLIGTLGVLSVDRGHVLFGINVAGKVAGGGLFASTGELAYLLFAMLIGLLAGPLQSASRTLLARMAPIDKQGQFFGLFAFSGKATAFLAPFAVAALTSLTGSQRWGIAVILAFLVVGYLLMLRVEPVREGAG